MAFQRTHINDKANVRDLSYNDIFDSCGSPWKCFVDIFWALYIGDHKKAQLCLNALRGRMGFAYGVAVTGSKTVQGRRMEITFGPRLDEGLNYTREEYSRKLSSGTENSTSIVNSGIAPSPSVSAKKLVRSVGGDKSQRHKQVQHKSIKGVKQVCCALYTVTKKIKII